MEALGIAGVALVLFLKESGVPIPVPGDLLVLGAAVAATRGEPPAPVALAVIVLAGVAGGCVQFLLLQGPARRTLLGVLARLGIGEDRLEPTAGRLRRHGARGVAVARMTPGVRTIAIPAAALAALPLVPFAAGLTVGNTVFVGGHFALGYVLGEPALVLLGHLGAGLAAAAVLLAVVGLIGWWLVTRTRHRVAHAPRRGSFVDETEDPVSLWADAACPACLAVAAVARVRRRGLA
jgi:membrane protein DedA with SNARE-associated domain